MSSSSRFAYHIEVLNFYMSDYRGVGLWLCLPDEKDGPGSLVEPWINGETRFGPRSGYLRNWQFVLCPS